jgi:uncharacterized protein (TIGR02001 family)
MKIMKKLIGAAMLAGAAVAGTAGVASADDGSVSGSVSVVSDYVFRGISQTGNSAAIQGSFDYTNGIFYAGTWGSSVGFTNGTELDGYFGVTPTVGPVSLDFGVLGYFYPSADDDGANEDYYEAKVAAHITPVEPITIGAVVYYSPDFFGETGKATYWEVNGSYAVSDALSFSAAYGTQDVDDFAGSYDNWNVGASYAAYGFKFGLMYTDTKDAFENGYGSKADTNGRVVFTVGRSL